MCLKHAPVSLVRIGNGDLGGEGYSQGLEVGQISADKGLIMYAEPKTVGTHGETIRANKRQKTDL